MAIENNTQFIALADVGRFHKEDHPDVVEDGYIVPTSDSINSVRIAAILETWIREAPSGSINLRSRDWILDQWREKRGVMVIGHPKDGQYIDIFGDLEIDDETLKQHIVSIAFINQLDGIPMKDEVELGTVLTNPHYQSNSNRRGVGGGIKAFQAVQDHAHKLFPEARLFSWVRNGSLAAIEHAFDEDTIWAYEIGDQAKAEAIFASCEGCPDSPGKGKCCHTGYEVKNASLGITSQTAS